jgi:hypothetical protein
MTGYARMPRATAAAVSGTHPTGIGRLRSAMARYISPILVDSVLQRALAAHPEKGQGTGALQSLTEDCMIGLRLFVDERQLPLLMLELAEILEDHDGR